MFHTEGYCRIYIELSIQVFYITCCFFDIPTQAEMENQMHLTKVRLFLLEVLVFFRGNGIQLFREQMATVIAVLLLPFSVLTSSVESAL